MRKRVSHKPNAARRFDDELRAIYADGDGRMPDLRRLERRRGSRMTRFLVRTLFLLVILSAASWTGFLLWSRGWLQGNTDPLTVSVEGADTVKGGEQTYYTIRYANHSHVPVASMSMKLNAPPGFRILSLTPPPTDPQGNTWTLGSLNPGSDGAIVVSGLFRSAAAEGAGEAPPAPQQLQAVFTFKPANFNSDFQDIKTKDVAVSGSVLALSISGPPSASAGDEADYVVTVQNTSSAAADHVRLILDPPSGYTVSGAAPKPGSPGAWQWDFATLAPGETQTVTVNGQYTASVAGTADFAAEAAFVDHDAPATQAVADAKTDVQKGSLSLALTVNGGVQNQGVQPNSTLHLTASYGNISGTSLGGVKIALAADTPDGKGVPIDWSKADLGAATRNGNVLTWDAKADPNFIHFAENQSGSFDVNLPLLPVDPSKMSDSVVFTLSASFTQGTPRTIQTSPITIGVNSDFVTTANGFYYAPDGSAWGSGPLPPAVGKTTSYRIVWTASNGLHDVKGFTMTAHIPGTVSWGGAQQPSFGALSFDPTTRTVSWAADVLAHDTPTTAASFTVSVTPGAADVNTTPRLLDPTAVTGMDASTNQVFNRTLDAITTSLPNDPGAKDKGTVANQ